MAEALKLRRRNRFNFLREAERLGSFDEFPMLRPDVDPQLHVSRNSVDQPFFLICEKDSVIAQPLGASRIELRHGPVRYFDTEAGDFVYIPAGFAHRVRTIRPGILLRYKARDFGGETVIWFCDGCGEGLRSHQLSADRPVQAGYADACDGFNADEDARRCGICGTTHAPLDLKPFRWRAVAEAVSASEETDQTD